MSNKSLKIVTILLVSIQISVSYLKGKCNECFIENKITCIDETHFSICFDGSPTTIVTKCPANRICTDDVLICHSFADGYTPSCYHDYCGNCQGNNGIFTCLDEMTYGYCFGDTTPLQSTLRSCPQGFVCNYNSRKVCVPKDKHQPSCIRRITTTQPTSKVTTVIATISTESIIDSTKRTTATTTTVTEISSVTEISTTRTSTQTSSSTDSAHKATIICKEIGKTGYFQSDDPTCRKYVYCYLLAGEYLGWFYYCRYYFNADTQQCQRGRPLGCIAHNGQ